MPIVKCKHCKCEWPYKGTRKVNVQCPDCRKYTPIKSETK